MGKWKKLPALQARNNPCLNCPPIQARLKLNRRIGVGFGFAGITKDGKLVWCQNNEDWRDLPTLMRFENMARRDPNHDWRVRLDGPLHGETYQRHDRNEWVLVETNLGFA